MNSVVLRIPELVHQAYTGRRVAGSFGIQWHRMLGMSTPFQFRVGDRVRARASGFIPARTLGTILEILYTVPTMYFVDFDGFTEPRLVRARDLEPAMEESGEKP
jgi:hypothetical protein